MMIIHDCIHLDGSPGESWAYACWLRHQPEWFQYLVTRGWSK